MYGRQIFCWVPFSFWLFVRRTDFFICLSCDIILVQYFDHKWIYCSSTIFECPFKLGFSFLIYCLDLLKGKKHLWQLQFKKCIQLCAFSSLKTFFIERWMKDWIKRWNNWKFVFFLHFQDMVAHLIQSISNSCNEYLTLPISYKTILFLNQKFTAPP